MTRETLKEYHDLQKAAEDVAEHIARCEKELERLDGAEGSGYVMRQQALAERRRHLRELNARIDARTSEVERFIFSIDSIRLQRIFILRYIDNMPWYKVAMNIGTDSTGDGVRKEHDRYMKALEGGK